MSRCYVVLGIFLMFCVNLGAQSCDTTRAQVKTSLYPFYHGVASGDPLSDAVVIWTRVHPDTALSKQVKWRIATDTLMQNLVDSGLVTTDGSRDFTVKVDVQNLSENTFYYYEFEWNNLYSVIGRTKTAPTSAVDSLRFAIVSCANYNNGYFNAYSRITERNDVSAILHLGDYYYEYGENEYGSFCTAEPINEIINLGDYRMRLSQYHLDEDLMRLHQQYPFICIWDDHETANNSWSGGAGNHDASEGNWLARKSEAIQAYFEWLPVRVPNPTTSPERIYRKFRYGDLVDLHMLDTRLEGRAEQGMSNSTKSSQSLLGADQFDWLIHNMDTSTAQWQILGQQVMMAPLKALNWPSTVYVNDDQWDGYRYERNRLYDSIQSRGINNMVVLTGDIHTSWANDLPLSNYNASTGANSLGVEFVATSVTSEGFPINIGTNVLQLTNTHMKYIDLTQRGYCILDVNKTRTQMDWFYVDKINKKSNKDNWGASWQTLNGDNHLSLSSGASVPAQSQIGTKAPLMPRVKFANPLSTQKKINLERSSVLLGLYPNPFTAQVMLQFAVGSYSSVTVQVFNITGGNVFNKNLGTYAAGIHRNQIDLNTLPTGTYVIQLKIGADVQQQLLIKQ